jgi:hypothetical protein
MGFLLKVEFGEQNRCSAQDLRVGELATVIDTSYAGQIVLRTHDGLVSLNNPRHTWGDNCALLVERLPKGTVLTLIVD